tara:strand:- start:71 stop:574 length:504 start_codon:yes stop_codon:yes gene_type:complete
MKSLLRHLFDRAPSALTWSIVRKRERKKRANSVRKNIETFMIQPRIEVDVYTKDLARGQGPAISIYIDEYEILKFDCFGPDLGHYHVSLGNNLNTFSERFALPAVSRAKQLEWVCFELQKNLAARLSMLPGTRFRGISIQADALTATVKKIDQAVRKHLQEAAAQPT